MGIHIRTVFYKYTNGKNPWKENYAAAKPN